MRDFVITIKSLAIETKNSVKNILEYFSTKGNYKSENDIVNLKEKEEFLIFLKNKQKKILRTLTLKKKTDNILNINNKDKKKFVKIEIRKKNFLLNKNKKTKDIILNKARLENKKKIYKKQNLSFKKFYTPQNFNKKNLNSNNSSITFNKNKNKKKYNRNYKIKSCKLYQNFKKPIKSINRNIIINENISVIELSNKMAVKSSKLIKIILNMGEKISNINQLLDQETAQLIAEEMGHKVILRHENDMEKLLINEKNNAYETPVYRAPVVTIMGHVDHGKTSLLDYIRSSNITLQEAGGITQHIGSYQVTFNNKNITFLDTPGHAAFTSMRFRGIQITDIVILVIAADDGVMPQTIEAIQHAQKIKVSIIVAINKIDKNIPNFEKIKSELSKYGLLSEEWGGNNIFVNISAKTGEGINNLLNAIILQAEILELKAVNKGMARGTVIEAYLDKGRGPIANILVKEGMLTKGNIVLCGFTYGKIRGLRNYQGLEVLEAGPSTPVEILGLSEIPYAGDTVIVVRDEKKAKAVATYRKNKYREKKLASKQKLFKKVFSNLDNKKVYELNILLKGDVQGTVEAIKDALLNLSNEKINVKIISFGVGDINETDISLAHAVKNNVIIIAFNIKANNIAKTIIKSENIKVWYFSIIYNLIENVQKYMKKIIIPKYVSKILGLAEVRNIFTFPKIGIIAGCNVINGIIKRNNSIKLLRNNIIVYEGVLESLRRFKENVNEVRNGMECGISIKNYNDIHIGDKIEVFEKN
ncbi:translation initiation factor IF-2 [Enterobacteriaceae endosymbiont of Donacia tomentosa]|uniref:translation initiation factor IF-2 n=1 Tax=Enterobacteriaceae endosymbiont of Donacia tomentosa TaxID=2675787 RepID=UPI00144A1861|nr:translation initiation factor IF-2 [Enterobacteriaceae endosymbiont of Donacia tomentosa]QJC31742.1 translation initiation factor IF-2 [Enterobacteriaceae endosymbiont of Donacia tomentosa]